jgi:hypothetical protein
MDQGKITRDSKNLVQLLDEYFIVIQEFFQKRVEIWLETVVMVCLILSTIGSDMSLLHPVVKFMPIFWQFVVIILSM